MNGDERSRTTTVGRVLCALALTAVATLLLLGPGMPTASAHDELVGATPVDGASVTTAPADVELQFSGVVQELGAQVAVTGPDGTVVGRGRPQVVDSVLTQSLSPELPAGTYTVAWRVTSADGHPISGTTSFTVRAGTATGATAPVSEAAAVRPADSSSGGWIGIGAVAVLLLALVGAARQLRGRA